MILALALLASLCASAAGPVGAPSVALLKERFLAATEEPERVKTLDELSKTTPFTAQDISALFDLFSRYPDAGLRRKVMDSLALLQADNPQLEPLFLTYLRQTEPESQLFGINGAFRLRSRQALPLVHAIAERKFAAASAASINALSERNEWWTQYEALSALAQWEGDKSLRLLREKAKEIPTVARLLGQYYWRQTFPELSRWAVSADGADLERAVEAAGAQISPADARATRDGMLALLRNPRADGEVRHRLALKVGASSNDAEVEELIREHDASADDKTRMPWAAAVFAARSPKSVPLLVRYAQQSADENTRAGARAELVDMLGEDPVKALLGDEKTIKK
jgi:hypothetical protein